jgi:ATP-dependent RNA helicase DDX5/DBP2
MGKRRGSRKNRRSKVQIEEQCVVSSWNTGGENEGVASEPLVALHHFETNDEPEGFSHWSAWRDCWKQLGWSPSLFQLHIWSSWKESAIQIVAPTGSGKTVAYGLPLLQTKLSVVLVPTRELCRQVQQECQRMAHSHHSIKAWYGGTVDKKSQFTEFKHRRGSSAIIVATPGRMWDILQSFPDSEFDLSVLVLDEADRLALNAELSEQVHNIAKALKPTKVILCSATQGSNSRDVWTQWMESAFGRVPNVTVVQVVSTRKGPTTDLQQVEDEADQPKKRRLEGTEIWSQIPSRVTQVVHVCAHHKKPPKLIKTLSKVSGPGLIFFAKITTLQYISALLKRSSQLKVMEYHSRLTQREREKPLQGIVLTTDLCARGIHWEEAKFVVNYDFPGNLETYIHRCGRVGRKSDGTVYSFFTRNFQKLAPDLVRLLESTNQWVDPNLQQLADESQEKEHEPPEKKQKSKQPDKPKGKDLDQLLDDEEKAFAALAGDRIVLKRASHVSDASSSSSDEDSGDEE